MRFRRPRPDPHQRLILDVDRTRGYMRAVIQDARRLDVTVPSMVVVSITAWGEWRDDLNQ